MIDEPLLTITRVVDCEYDVDAVGTLDYRIHCQALERWLAAGVGRATPQTVEDRRRAFATELRTLADAIEGGGHPFVSSIEGADALATEIRARIARYARADFKAVP